MLGRGGFLGRQCGYWFAFWGLGSFLLLVAAEGLRVRVLHEGLLECLGVRVAGVNDPIRPAPRCPVPTRHLILYSWSAKYTVLSIGFEISRSVHTVHTRLPLPVEIMWWMVLPILACLGRLLRGSGDLVSRL